MHGCPARYLLSGQRVAFFTICILIRLEKSLLSVSVSGQQNANRYRYLKKIIFDAQFTWMNAINHLSAPKCHCPEWIGTSYNRYKEGGGFGEWWEQDCAHNIDSKISYDFLNNYLYLYPAIRQILLSGIICIRLSGKFYYPELSVSGKIYYPCIPNNICGHCPTQTDYSYQISNLNKEQT